jgi:uncharacterized protein YidB (DUF937 family)
MVEEPRLLTLHGRASTSFEGAKVSSHFSRNETATPLMTTRNSNHQNAQAMGLHTDMATVVSSVIERHGGIEGLMRRFAQVGLLPTIKSWVIPGTNRPVTAEQIQQAVGPSLMCELAAKVGISPQTLALRLACILPSAIDSLTPNRQLLDMP